MILSVFITEVLWHCIYDERAGLAGGAVCLIAGGALVWGYLVSCPDPTSKEEKGLVNLGRILGPALRNFHAPIRSLLWHCHVTSLPQECNIAILAVQAKSHTQSC